MFALLCETSAGFRSFVERLPPIARGKRHRKSLDRGKSRAATTCLGGQKLCACASVYASRISIARFAAVLPHVFFLMDGKLVKTRRRASAKGLRSPMRKRTAFTFFSRKSSGLSQTSLRASFWLLPRSPLPAAFWLRSGARTRRRVRRSRRHHRAFGGNLGCGNGSSAELRAVSDAFHRLCCWYRCYRNRRFLQLGAYRQSSAQAGGSQEGRFGREAGTSRSRASWFHVRRDPEEGPLDLLLPYRDVLHCLVRNRRHRLLDGVLHLVRHGGHHSCTAAERVHVFGGRA